VKAVIVPSKGSSYRLEQVKEPVREKGQVKVKVLRAALCYRDLLQLKGFYPRMKYPVILGHEMVGEVIESDGEFKVGEKVVSTLYAADGSCRFCISGDESHCLNRLGYSEELDGFFSEYAIVRPQSLVKVPEGVREEDAVISPCVSGMIYAGLRRAGLKPGELVVVTGAGGGVGVHAVQVASALGAKVVAVTSDKEKLEVLGKYVSNVILGSKFADQVGREADVVIDTVGTPTIDESLRSLRQGGRLVQVGNVDPTSKYELRLGYVILKDLQVIGHASANRSDIEAAMRLCAEGKLRAVIAGIYGLDEIDRAFSVLLSRSRVGKVLLSPFKE